MQDLLFHNDFEYFYPDDTQQLHAVVNDIINTPRITTNITYAAPGASPVVGACEFREGTSFLGTLQEIYQRAGWLFYVDDALALQDGTPGFDAAGVTLESTAGDADSNLIKAVLLRERDGDKLYNYIKLYGKNPMFDGYTEQNAASWTALPAGNILDDAATVRVGTYSQVVYNTNAGARSVLRHNLALPVFSYLAGEWDFSKGEIGCWGYYDNNAGAPGNPQAGVAPANEMVEIRLIDNAGALALYYGASTKLYIGEWGWVSAPLGEAYDSTGVIVPNEWCVIAGPGNFNWNDVRSFWFQMPRSNLAASQPAHLYIDGITLPIPCIAVAQDAVSQGAYRTRPYVDTYSHIQVQNALQQQADILIDHHKDSDITRLHMITPGNINLHYAGQTIDVDIPSMGINTQVYYMTEIHHIIEPYVDVSEGYGFDWITEVEAVPTSGETYTKTRLRDGPAYGSYERVSRAGTAIREK